MPDSKPAITANHVANAEIIAGLSFTQEEREQMLENLNDTLTEFENLRKVSLNNSVSPSIGFDPRLPGMEFDTHERPAVFGKVGPLSRPDNLEELAFFPVTHLAELIRTKQVSALELTQMYLDRLKRYDQHLKCVVTLTEDRALQQARQADTEIKQGQYRGLLHGIPWGAKDLLAVSGYPTTWGAKPFEQQQIELDAAVVQRLDEAGAVLIAKLTTGALAYGDVWFGGQTKSPWDLEVGSSGSSAGPGSATAAGCVGFSIGSETLGSIVSPSRHCATTGLRPTFGRVSRFGAMALSWSMDKLGPMCRSVEDCAAVFDAIHGPDGQDLSVTNYGYNWNANRPLSDIRIGVVPAAFDRADDEEKNQNNSALETIKSLGVELIEIDLPDFPYHALRQLLVAEAAAAFDELTRLNQDDLMVRQSKDAWPNLFRAARLMPAVEYIQANRVRTQLMHAMHDVMQDVDVYLTPASDAVNLVLTNLTGHPTVVLPNSYPDEKVPVNALTFTANLYGEANALLVAKAFQEATDYHLRQPNMNYDG